eukprot:CAMPEP_0178533400 /NCGR_PEP_ID=MMETSP0696-20121128/34470_1 /TAXON_ID=265572 /ORGANISM="Extubocellulus spinifer, Strain CCMP396" /LENGTH=539 /DNA_ID=CAMNT_0020165427 /DNA_START=231 /DNA_END=1850 /DNA_ORIENTATION=-
MTDNAGVAGARLEQTHEGEFHGDHGDGSVPVAITSKTKLFAFCAALNSCNLGYDIGVSSEAGMLLKDSMMLSDTQVEIFMGSLNLFAMVGALLSHVIADRSGRRGAFIIAAVSFIIGVIIQSAAQNYGTLMAGRLFVGLGVGSGLAIDPVYIAEISPAAHRGRLVTWSEIALNVGIVLGFASGAIFYSLPSDTAWRYMFALGAILPTIMIFLAIFVMPESPRWLVSKGKEEEAKDVLQKLYPGGYNVDHIVYEIKESIEREVAAEKSLGWDMILFPTPAFRRMLFVGIGSAISQQACGVDALQYFLVFIVNESGIESRGAQTTVLIILGLIKLFFIFIGGYFFDRKGRRPMFFISLLGMMVALVLLSITFFANATKSAFAVCSLALYFAFFSLGMGPGAWLIPSEVFAITVRAKAMSVATFMNRVTATLMSSTFLTTANAMSYGGFFLLLAGICLIVLAFFYWFVPETRGRPLEDMSLYFAEITGDNSVLEAEAKLRAAEDVSVEMSGTVAASDGATSTSNSARTEDIGEGSNVVGTMA